MSLLGLVILPTHLRISLCLTGEAYAASFQLKPEKKRN